MVERRVKPLAIQDRSQLKLKSGVDKFVQWVIENPWLTILFIIGIIVRVVAFTSAPPGLNQDEASIGYDAYSILHYGIDRNGSFLPIHLIAWGSGQNALYAYLSMPFIYLLGLNPFSIRIVSVLAGIVTLFLFYAIAKRLFNNNRASIIAVFIVVICPWHIMMSRWALESNLFPTIVLLAVYFVVKSLDRPNWLFAYSVTMAISLYAYGTAYFFAPLFVISVYVLLAVRKIVSIRAILLNGLTFTVVSMPILLFILINRYSFGAIEALFTIPKLTKPRFEQTSTAFQSDLWASSIHNFKQFLHIIVTQNDGLIWNAIPPFGYMYPIALPFILIGLVTMFGALTNKLNTAKAIVALWFIVAALMAFITDVNINRINIVFYPILFFTVAGLLWLLKNDKWIGRGAVAAFAIFFLLFSANYYTRFPDKISAAFYESFGEAINYASEETEGKVYITDRVNMPYIYVLTYEKISPHAFLDSVKYRNKGDAFQWVDSFDRYQFGQPQIHEGEQAAYLFANGEQMPEDESQFIFKRFKHYTVVTERQ